MQALLILIATLVALFSPRGEHGLFVTTVATVVLEERPLFADDESRARTSALLVAVAFRESTFDFGARSKTNDFGAFQLHNRADLLDKPAEQTRVAMTMLRESMRACPEHPLSHYAEGPRGCSSPRAQRISADRMALAKWALGKATQ